MRRLSEATYSLVSQLHGQLQVSARRRSAPEILETIQTIAVRRELAAIPELVAGIFDKADSVAIAATQAIHELLETACPEDLPEIDQSMRVLDWKFPDSWLRLSPEGLAKLLRPGVSEISGLGLASFHRSGHVRQRAVELLARLHDG